MQHNTDKNGMKHLYVSHASSKGFKKLFITGYGKYLVEMNNKKVLECDQAVSAIEKFNWLWEK